MGIFTEEQKVRIRPEVLYGAQTLQNLAGTTPAIPQQGVAELTPMQQLIQSQLGGYLGRIGEYGGLAADYYRDVLGSPYGFENDPQAQFLQQQAEIAGGQAITASRRGMESRGLLDSSYTPWEDIRSYMGAINPYAQARVGLLRDQAGRKERAAQGIQQVGRQELEGVAAVGGIADQQRMIEQARQDALYQQLIMQILFPYQYQARLAESLMQMPGGVQVTGGGMTDLSQGLILGGTVAGAVLNPSGGAAAMTGGGEGGGYASGYSATATPGAGRF